MTINQSPGSIATIVQSIPNNDRYRSYTNLVIKAHQHTALKMTIRSHSDFWKGLRLCNIRFTKFV